VRFIYIDFAFLGPESFDAAEAAHCAQDQGQFWEYHDILFANQKGENQGDFKRDNLLTFARQLKLDEATFTRCLDDHKYRDFVRASGQEWRRRGIRGTPTVVVNGQLVANWDFPELDKIIQQELSK
jgi:protein-disulfide isomerase